jgi:hypothetical protein
MPPMTARAGAGAGEVPGGRSRGRPPWRHTERRSAGRNRRTRARQRVEARSGGPGLGAQTKIDLDRPKNRISGIDGLASWGMHTQLALAAFSDPGRGQGISPLVPPSEDWLALNQVLGEQLTGHFSSSADRRGGSWLRPMSDALPGRCTRLGRCGSTEKASRSQERAAQ